VAEAGELMARSSASFAIAPPGEIVVAKPTRADTMQEHHDHCH
jgi:hypothetical protein